MMNKSELESINFRKNERNNNTQWRITTCSIQLWLRNRAEEERKIQRHVNAEFLQKLYPKWKLSTNFCETEKLYYFFCLNWLGEWQQNERRPKIALSHFTLELHVLPKLGRKWHAFIRHICGTWHDSKSVFTHLHTAGEGGEGVKWAEYWIDAIGVNPFKNIARDINCGSGINEHQNITIEMELHKNGQRAQQRP